MRNFIRKWGRMVEHDQYMLPIVNLKYDIGLIISSCLSHNLEQIEPYFTKIYTNSDVSTYIEKEQPLTLYNLKDKFVQYKGNPRTDMNDIVVACSKPLGFNESEEIHKLMQLPYLLDNIKEPGTYVLFDGCNIYVNYLGGLLHEENIK